MKATSVIQVCATACAALCCGTLFAGSNTYEGPDKGDWFVDDNWALKRVPTTDDDVSIQGKTVYAAGDISACSLHIVAGAALHLGSSSDRMNVSAAIVHDLVVKDQAKLYVYAGELEGFTGTPESYPDTFANQVTATAAIYTNANVISVGGDFTVQNGATVYPDNAPITGTPVFFKVEGDFELAADSSIDTTQRGWGWVNREWETHPAGGKVRLKEGKTIWKGWTLAFGSGRSYGCGGGYGGAGLGSPLTFTGVTPSVDYGLVYGTDFAPFLPGSPAGWFKDDINGARGSGSICIFAEGTANIAGTLNANGATSEYGGASGGGIWLAAGEILLDENASLLAHGMNTANNNYKPGGGGRIALLDRYSDFSEIELLAESSKLPADYGMTAISGCTVDVAPGAKPNQDKATAGTAVRISSAASLTALLTVEFVGEGQVTVGGRTYTETFSVDASFKDGISLAASGTGGSRFLSWEGALVPGGVCETAELTFSPQGDGSIKVNFAVTDDPITEPEEPVNPPVVDPEEPPTDVDPIEPGTNLLLEAEAFVEKGGWVVDPQFVEQMGSPYLLAHGKGVPVADASVWVNFSAAGKVRAYVRTRDWTPDYDGEKPGRFRLAIGGKAFPNTLGVSPETWGWADAGVVEVAAGTQKLALKDLTGFEGRCDAVFLTSEDNVTPPPNDLAELAAWRAATLGEAGAPEDVVEVDYVVVGGGIAGTAAAVAAADAGLAVALVQDRPMLGGNASDEVRVKTEKAGNEYHWIVKAIKNGPANANSMAKDDAARQAFVDKYAALQTHLGWRAYGVVTNAERKIVAVDARHVETGARRRFVAPLYCDATGDGWLGYWAGAAYRIGREAKEEYDEPTHGQDTADSSTMGNSLLWTTKTGSEAYVFPSVPWATKVSGSRADTAGRWQWEAGLDPAEDTIDDAEMLRDRLFRAAYGSFSNTKAKSGNERLVFNFLGYIAGKRESRRIIGDYVVREKDVTEHRQFEDAIGIATWSVDLHHKSGSSGFLAETTQHQYGAWWMPYRSLCCRDVPNLFLAGRCASYTHVAFGSSRVMHAGGQQGVATGYAASLCKKYSCLPREIYQDANKTAELQNLVNAKSEYVWPTMEVTVEHDVVIVDNADETGVEVSGEWLSSSHNADRYGANYLHNNTNASDNLWVRYTPTLSSNATYQVSLFWNGDSSRGDKVPVEITYADGVTTNYVNMKKKSSTWNAIGSWPFETDKPASVRILTVGQSGKTVIADAVKFAIVEMIEPGDDTDSNGLPDAWERRHFLQITGTDPEGDPDGDGRDNLQEYRDGTDPNVADEAPEVVPPYIGDFAVDSVSVTLSWEGSAGCTYRVLSVPALTNAFEVIGEPIPGEDGLMSVSLPKGSSPSAFYRIKVE